MQDHRGSRLRRAAPHLRSAPLALGIFVGVLVGGLLRTDDAGSARFAATLPVPATIALSPSGNDSSCARNDPQRPCATFDRAFQLAHGGDTVVVGAGTYRMTEPSAGATSIFPAKRPKHGSVTFVCQGNGVVTFAGPVFAFYPGLGGVSVSGGCFRFHVVHFGYGGYPDVTHDITLEGVHMESFECAGCANVTIEDSEVGPAVFCDGVGSSGAGANGGTITQAMWCDPSKPEQAYWAGLPGGSSGQQMEPYIHDSVGARPQNFALVHDHIHGIQSTDSFNLHAGGLLIWDVDGLLLRGNTFDHNAVYDISDNQGSNDANVTIENNVFGWPVEQIDSAQACPGCETTKDWRDVDIGNGSLSNVLIRYNSFAHGLQLYNSYAGGALNASNVRVVGNILGSWANCPTDTGVTYDHNVGADGGPSCGGLTISTSPYVDYAGVDFDLVSGSAAAGYVPGTTADQQIATDANGASRTAPYDAGALRAG